MKKNYYRLLAGSYYTVATYCGTKSNANAYFRRWASRNVPGPFDDHFIIHVYSNYFDFLHGINVINITVL
ncbi:hypothetical protein [Bacteroides congonensis]|uniref:hypothetical protein n=1 Tax=Bacteroides congonensis TaxID=1871006 RepID=UPI00321B0CE7